MKQTRIHQLLKLYNGAYAKQEAWKAKRLAAVKAQRPKAAVSADNAARYWETLRMKLRKPLLV